MSVNHYEIVLSPGVNKIGWYASVYRVDDSKDEILKLVKDEKCDDYITATQRAWEIMQSDREDRGEKTRTFKK